MKFELPPADPGVSAPFANLADCRAWIRALPLLNPVLAQTQLLDRLRALNSHALPGAERLDMLEALQTPIRFVQTESALSFSGKPLPLATAEQQAIERTHELWQALLMGYLRCLENLLGGDASLTPRTALVCQRALAAVCDDHADLVRAGSHPDSTLWRFAHAVYASAETLGVAEEPVPDPQRTLQHGAGSGNARAGQPVSPAAAFVELVLIAAASLHELPSRHQRWVMGWARRWAPKVVVLGAPPAELSALPLCVDLESETPPGFRPRAGKGARWLDTAELRKSMKLRLVLLARGQPGDTPARLGLGEDCTQPSCGEILRRLYPRWVKGGVQRRYERHPMGGRCRFVAGVDAIHYYVSGRQPFRPPGSTGIEELQRQRDELATFGRVASRFEEEYSRDRGFQFESWTVVEDWGMFDQSEDGLRLVRPLAQNGGRLGIGQLVGVQPSGRGDMLLGVVRWSQVAEEELATGIQIIQGQPEAVAARPTVMLGTPEPYRPAFVVTAPEGAAMPICLILPPGGFKPGRMIETWTPIATRRFKLEELLERGADFERASAAESR